VDALRVVVASVDVVVSAFHPGNSARDIGDALQRAIADPTVYARVATNLVNALERRTATRAIVIGGAASRRHGTLGDERDYALILDGLACEREQNITIDVAYRFFTTARRKFIVIDAPGHEQYTRNMATGASTADLAVLLVSASEGLTRQTRRHALIVSTLAVRHLVVAVNKMDLVDWSESRFTAIAAEVRAVAGVLGLRDIAFIPVAGSSGDNVAHRSHRMSWYRGPALLEYLEEVQIPPPRQHSAFRMPVQWVNRPGPEFRGYCVLVASGQVYPGMAVQVLPSGQRTIIERIVTAGGDLPYASAGQAVTLVFADEIDASRGDVVAEVGPPAEVTNRLSARLVWIGADALVSGHTYLLKLAAATVRATIEPGLQVVDLDTYNCAPAQCLVANDIGAAIVGLDRCIAADRYRQHRSSGLASDLHRPTRRSSSDVWPP
jgi:sulfate adenylyltransferase subunit 1